MQTNMDEVVRELKERHRIDSYVEQTGGGTATIFAGEKNREDRYQACAGPGWFEGPGWTNARGDTADFYVGPDDDGEADPVMAEESWTETDIAGVIAEVVNR